MNRRVSPDAAALGQAIADAILAHAYDSDSPRETFDALTLRMQALDEASAIVGRKRAFLLFSLRKQWRLTHEQVGEIVGRTRERVGQIVRRHKKE